MDFSPSVHSLERINPKLSEDVQGFWENPPAPPTEEEGELRVCTAEGKGVPIRGAAKDPVIEETPPNQGPKPGRKKRSIVAVYTIDPSYGRRRRCWKRYFVGQRKRPIRHRADPNPRSSESEPV